MRTKKLFLPILTALFLFISMGFAKGQNTLSIINVSALPSSEVTVEVVMTNANPVVAFQLDIALPTGFTYVASSATLSGRATNHTISASVITGNYLRILSSSGTNDQYTGTSGAIATFKLNSSSTVGAYSLVIQANAVLSSPTGVNIISGTTNGTVTVAKGTPTVTWPTASSITYGAQLSTATLSGGSATYNAAGVPGAFAYTSPTTVPNAGTYVASVSFTPTDVTRYNTVDGTVNVTVNQRAITLTADAKTKVYGNTDPAFTYQVTSGSLVAGDSWTGTPTRVAGENVGTYAINKGTVAASPVAANYNITWVSANLSITSRPITVTATAKSKIYGDTDPALTYTVTSGSLATGDAWTGALTRVAGEGVGTYAINQGTLAITPGGANYTLTYVGANFTITSRPVTITAAAKTKVYGDADPALTYTVTSGSLVAGDSWTGSLTRVAGENVGAYAINQGTVAITPGGANYTITYVSANLTITAKALTITADAKSKVYGNADPTFTYTSSGLIGGDVITGALSRVAGENVGSYAIQQGTLTAGSNYTITYTGANLTITARPITITADPKTKVYGDADPAFTYQVTSGSLAGGDALTGTPTRVAGEALGTYAINQGTVTVTPTPGNYTITWGSANLTITSRPITITSAAKSKVYGDADPALTYTVTSGSLVAGDSWTGSLTRVAGEGVGTYAINQGTVAITPGGANYTITYVGANLTITQRPITITAAAKSKVYGDADPALTYTVTSGSLVAGDSWTGSLSRVAGETVGTYAIQQNTVAITPGAANYTLTYVGANLTVTSRLVTITADAKTKVYGETDPALTYQVTSGSLAAGDSWTGALTRVAGEDVGTRQIQKGTVAPTNASNYTITYNAANLTITARPITITAGAKSKVYGNADPALTYTVTSGSLATGDSWTGSLTRVAGENVGTYAINQGSVAITPGGANYTLTYVSANLTITSRAVTITADVKTKVYGDADPALTYQVTSGTLAAGDSWTGLLTRVAGANVGTYAINQGTVAITPGGANYTLTYVGANLTITAKAITVVADAKSKVYGASDPALTYVATGLVGGDAISGVLSRIAGENVGTYAIQQNTLTAGSNYTITYTGANLTITARALTITANSFSKTVGVDYVFTGTEFTNSTLYFSDAVTSCTIASAGAGAAATPGTYPITISTAVGTGLSNYTITYVEGTLTVQDLIELTLPDMAASSKVYDGNTSTTISNWGTLFGVQGGDNVTLITTSATATFANKNVGTGKTVTVTNLVLGGDDAYKYYIGDQTTTANITVRTLIPSSFTASNKVYDGTTTVSGTGFSDNRVAGDALTFTYSTAFVDKNVGTGKTVNYTGITISGGTDAGNYVLSTTSGSTTANITAKAITVVADAKSKVYGAADPALSYVVTGLVGGDAMSGALSRVAGENVGTYAIQQNTLTAGSNYTITYTGANLTITAKAITVVADAKSKVYGAADPALTYVVTGLVGGDAMSGALSRVAGNNVGTYAIQQNTLTAGSNYTITYTGANLTITTKAITVVADAKSKVYGTADPSLTYVVTGLVGGDAMSGALSRVVGDNVGTYAIQQNTLTAGSNYTITYTGANLTITAKAITVVADAKSKVYGAADPALTYVVTGLVGGDAMSGALSRVAGENVGTYAIQQNTLTAGSNYTITYTGANLAITAKSITVVADAKSKVYGAADPALTYVVTGLVGGDAMSGALSRVAGNNVGTYAIQQNTLTAGSNYTITYTGANLTITAKALTITADAQTKSYGAADPTLTYTATGVVAGDTPTGTLEREMGENVGTYAINIGSLSYGSNYDVTYNGADLSITPGAITITANDIFKTVGATYSFTGSEFTPTGILYFGDAVTSATLTSAGAGAGATVGTYPIIPSNAIGTGLSNYNITYIDGTMTVEDKISLTLPSMVANNKVYDGNTSATINTYGALSGVEVGDDVTLVTTGAVASFGSRAVENNKIVTVTGLALGGVDAYKYAIGTQSTTANITKRTLVPSAFTASNKVYDRTSSVTGTGFSDDRIAGDVITFTYTAAFADMNVGTGKNVNYTAIAISGGADAGNYTLSTTTGTTTANITAKPITVTADAKTKVYGSTDPSLTYTVVGLITGDNMSGGLTRVAGENVGTYAINLGTLTAGSNYSITYTGALLEITVKNITITVNSGQTKVYGSADPVFTYTTTGVVTGDTPTGALSRVAGENVGTYAINIGTLSYGSNYTATFNGSNFSITAKAITVTADAKSKVYGSVDPALTYTVSGLVGGDAMSGELSRAAGENVGTYAILKNTLTAGSNYNLTYVGANLTITAKALTITADAKSKVYGETDPALTYNVVGLVGGDEVTGSLIRITGENVGTYAINQGTLTAGTNYTITYTGASLTISSKELTITANAGQSKVYGSTNPTYTYSVVGVVGADAPSGALSRAAGENVGTYAIIIGTLSYGANYTINFVAADFEITAKAITIAANSGQTKVYGDADPVLTFTVTGVVTGDTYTGALSRAAGEVVGSYAITLGDLSYGSNYTVNFVSNTFVITKKSLTVTANSGQTKVYGDADPVFTYTASGFVLGDTPATALTGTLSRNPGANVGSYDITIGTLAAANYSINFVSAVFTITTKSITITANAGQTKVYGSADPVFTYTTVGLVGGSTPTGALSRENSTVNTVGSYAITIGTLSYGSNYSAAFVSANFTITPKALTITANDRTKSFGQTLVFNGTEFTTVGLVTGDAANTATITSTGADAGAVVGTYPIVISNAVGTGLSNYTISYVNGTLTVADLIELSLTGLTANSKTYDGNSTASIFSYGTLQGVVGGDEVTLVSDFASSFFNSKVVGTNRQVTVTGLSLIGTDAHKYFIDNQYTTANVSPKDLTLSSFTASNKVYNGTTSVTGTGFADDRVVGDNLTFSYTAAFENKNVADNKTVNYTGISISGGTDAGNYTLVTTSGVATANITPKTLTIEAVAQTKVYGDADPSLTYIVVSGLVTGENAEDVMSGDLTRIAGEDVGTYAIQKGTLSAGVNYSISFISRNLTITPKEITVTANASQSKVYGEVDPELTYSVTGLAFGEQPLDVMTGSLSREAGNSVGLYNITIGTLSAGVNYTISFVSNQFEITPKAVSITADVQTKVYGDSDPVFTYTYPIGSFVGADADNITGVLSRLAGEDVGVYQITEGDLSIGTNYTMNFVSANLTINQKALTVTANDIEKAEGVEFGFNGTEFTSSGLVTAFGDGIASATLSSGGAAAAAAIGDYEITISNAVGAGVTDLANYSITYVPGTMSVVAKIPLTLSGTIAQNKVYDGTADVTITDWGTVTGIEAGDVVSVNFTGAVAQFEDKNVGDGKQVSITGLTLEGTDASKYIIGTQTTTANISIRDLTLSNFVADAKEYDGTTSVTGAGFNDDRVPGDNLTFAFDVAFTDANVDPTAGNPKTVEFTNILLSGGTDVLNYTLVANTGSVVSSITPRPLTITADANQTKVYGESDPVLTWALTAGSLVVGEEDAISGSLSREAGQNVGSYAIQIGSLSTGTNYAITYVSSNFTITKKGLTVTANSFDKPVETLYTFDGSEFTAEGLVANYGDAIESVSLQSDGAAAAATVGTYAITIESIVPAAGTDLNNYNVNTVNGVLTVIDRISVTLAGVNAESKVYDGTTDASILFWGTLAGVEPGDDVVLDNSVSSAAFADKNVGESKVITITGLSLTGADAIKYIIGDQTAAANITAKDLILSNFTAADKVFDGTTTVSGTSFDDDRLINDVLEFTYDAAFALPNVGVGVNVNFTNITISGGADKNNYSMISTNGVAQADITAKPISVTADAGQSKILGEIDPVFTYTFDAGQLEGSDELSGALGREAGDTVGEYQINIGTLTAGDNYNVSLANSEVFTIYALLTLEVLPESSGTVTGGGQYLTADQVELTATPAEGFAFVNWTNGETVVSTNPSFAFTMPAENVTLVANFEEIVPEYYTVTLTVNPENSGTVHGQGEYEVGAQVTITATPNEGYVFYKWKLNEEVLSSDATYIFNMPAENIDIVANFVLEGTTFYTLTLEANPSEGGTVEGGAELTEGEQVTITATPAEGYLFVNWTNDGVEVSTLASFEYTMPAVNTTLVANFELDIPDTYILALEVNPVEGGNVTGNGEYEEGTLVDITATPAEGYQFVNWTSGEAVVSTEANFTFTMPANDTTLVANFVAIFNVSLTVVPEGTGSVTGDGVYAVGAEVNIVATPNVGYVFQNWRSEGSAISADANYTFTMPAMDLAISAYFIEEGTTLYTLTLEANPVEGGSVVGQGEFIEGEQVNITAIPATGYLFVNWTNGGVEVSADASFAFTMPAENTTLVANFELDIPDIYILTLEVNPIDGGTVNGGGEYEEGSNVSVTATPAADYLFVSWTNGEVVVSTNPDFTLTMPSENTTLVANFEYVPPTTYTVTFTVTSNSLPVEGAIITLSGVTENFTTNVNGVATAELEDGYYDYSVSAEGYVTSSGSFTVNGTALNINITLTSVGIEFNALSNLSIYPNPFRSTITFSEATDLKRIVVCNILGKVMMDVSVEQSYTHTFDVNLPSGVYMITLIANDGSIDVRKIVRE